MHAVECPEPPQLFGRVALLVDAPDNILVGHHRGVGVIPIGRPDMFLWSEAKGHGTGFHPYRPYSRIYPHGAYSHFFLVVIRPPSRVQSADCPGGDLEASRN